MDFSEKVTFLSLTRPPPHGAPLRARQGPLRAPVRRVPRQGRRGVVIRAEHRTCYARASPGNQGGLSGVSRRTGGWARLCYVSFFLFFFGRRGQHGSRVEVRLGLCADVVAELYKVCREFRAGVELARRSEYDARNLDGARGRDVSYRASGGDLDALVFVNPDGSGRIRISNNF